MELDHKGRSLVFIVDDNIDTAEMLGHFLKSNNHVTRTFDNGEDLLKALENPGEADIPDIMLIDLMMPGLDGIEVIQQIKSNPNLTYIPIIMVTANGDNQNRILGLQSGADDFLTKPISRAELLARVDSLLRLKQAYDEKARLYDEKTRLLVEMEKAYDDLKMARIELAEAEKHKLQVDVMMTTAAGICHEMSQPLTSALITLQLIEQTGNLQELEDIKTVESSLLQARVILNKLRALTRYETTSYMGEEHMLDLSRSSGNVVLDLETEYDNSSETIRP